MAKDDFWQPSFNDLITVGAVVVAAVMWLKQPSWQWALPITAFVVGLVIFTALRHPAHAIRRAFVAMAVIGILVWAAWAPIRDSFGAEYPNYAVHWPLSFASAKPSNFPPEFMRDGCGGTLHRADGDLRFGGEEGEGESICIINKAEEGRVLAVCSIGHPCRIKGDIEPCVGSGECDKISRIKSVAVVAELMLPSEAPAWVQIAYQEQGQAEIPGPEENSRIVEYFSAIGAKKNYRDDVDDWASAFVEWSLNKNGITGPKSDDPLAWLHWGQKLDHPRFGCITVLSFSGLRHVGLFFSDNGDSILVLGGNQNDAVNISRYSKSDVLGFRWPPKQK